MSNTHHPITCAELCAQPDKLAPVSGARCRSCGRNAFNRRAAEAWLIALGAAYCPGCLDEAPPEPEPLRFDVRASVNEIDGPGGDGAYDLIGDGLTVDEVLERLRKVLTDGFGLTNAGACYLTLHIGPAGRGSGGDGG